jgi:DNA-binding CsgD family transcriptional regulator
MGGRGRPRHPDILTPREWEVMDLLRAGRSNEEIATSLGISVAGAKYHVSEILGKLQLSDRKQAATWRPDEAPHARALSLPFVRFVRRDTVPALVGASAATVVVVALGLLIWGIVASRDGESASGAWTYDGTHSDYASVVVFDLANRQATQIPVPDDTAYARWVKDGETFIARQQNGAPDGYAIYGLDGQRVLTPLLQGDLTSDVVPAPGGDALIVGRTDNQYLVSELPDGFGSTLLTNARNIAFSPDGSRMAFLTVGGSDKEGINHDWRSIMIAEKSELTGYSGSAMALQSQREADGLMDLARRPWSPHVQPWSPDSQYLLVVRHEPCFQGVATASCYGLPSYEVYGTQLTGKTFWSAYPQELQSVMWAGPGRLFITFFPDREYDPDFPDAQSLYVDFGLLKEPVPAVLQGACCVTFSPDGRYAVVLQQDEESGERRCSLVDSATGAEIAGFDARDADIRIFCGSVDWTADATKALVSSGNGN